MIARLNKRLDEARDGGFTLIELLIVIVILGILAAIVVFAIGGTRDDAVANACKSAVKQVEVSAEAVKTKTGKYPADKAASVAKPTDYSDQSAVDAYFSNLVQPSSGALLKNYPASSDYTLIYDHTPAVTTAGSEAAETFVINVYPGNKGAGGTGPAAVTLAGTGQAGCASLE